MDHTLESAMREARARLAADASAESDARELVSRLAGLDWADLAREHSRRLSADEWRRLEAWIERRRAGEPVQYITGRAAFRSLDLAVDGRVLIPRPETELLVEAVLDVVRDEAARWERPRVLDLGTGSGAIALAVAAEAERARVTASDTSADALEVARANAEALGLEDRVAFVLGDWFDAVGADDRFEVVVSNPPYIATGEWDALPDEVRRFEPHTALFSGSSGLDALRTLVDEAPQHLVGDGLLALELAESRAAEVAAWLEGAHDWRSVSLLDDLTGRPRILLARRARGPAIAPAQWEEES